MKNTWSVHRAMISSSGLNHKRASNEVKPSSKAGAAVADVSLHKLSLAMQGVLSKQ
jgi:hypothetical protein